jgi:hypothetical protein
MARNKLFLSRKKIKKGHRRSFFSQKNQKIEKKKLEESFKFTLALLVES